MDADNLRTGRLFEGDNMFTNLLGFPESQGPPPAFMGMPPGPAGSLKTPTSRPSPATVAHRPWEDSIPCGPRWPQDYYFSDGLPDRLPGKPKTFKPVLLYHRPEEPELPYPPRYNKPCCDHMPQLHACEGDVEDWCSFHCHEDAEENMRDFLHSAMVHDQLCRMGHDVYDTGHGNYVDCSCSCGCQHPLGPRPHSFHAMKHSTVNRCQNSLQRPERTAENFRRHCHDLCSFTNDPFSYPLALFPQNSMTDSPRLSCPVSHRTQSLPGAHRTPSHSIMHRTPYSIPEPPVLPPLTSFPLPLHNRVSPTYGIPKQYIPMFSRQAETSDRDCAIELHRALLANHPVFDDSSNRDHAISNKHGRSVDIHNTTLNDNLTRACTDNILSSKRMDPDRKQTSSSSSYFFNINPDLTSTGGQLRPPSAMTSPVTRPGSALSAISQISPVSSLKSDGSDGWQDWSGRYGSFLQFLNSPESPRPPGISSGGPPPSYIPDTASKPPPAANRLTDCVDVPSTLEQTTQWAEDPSLGKEEGAVDSVEDRDSKRHTCPYCDVTCTNNGQLKGHLRVHTGERPYRCQCGRAFARNEELTRHRRIHSGLRPHVCTTCGKRFGRKDHLNKHQKTHLRTSEKKTHMCQIAGCQQRYTRSDALARHQWGAHGIKAKTSRIRPLLQGQGHDPAALSQLERSLADGPDLLPFAASLS